MIATRTFLELEKDNFNKVMVQDVFKNTELEITIDGIPNSVDPLNWEWQMRTEPAFVNGYQDWTNGTLIQANNGTLATNTTNRLTLLIPIVNSLELGDSFGFTFSLGNPIIDGRYLSVVYTVMANSSLSSPMDLSWLCFLRVLHLRAVSVGYFFCKIVPG
jgi:hypothetical protein